MLSVTDSKTPGMSRITKSHKEIIQISTTCSLVDYRQGKSYKLLHKERVADSVGPAES